MPPKGKINVAKTLENFRNSPGPFQNKSDEYILRYLQRKLPNEDWGSSWIQDKKIERAVPLPPDTKDYPNEDELVTNADPQGLLSKLLLMSPLELIGSDWAREKYNDSTAGHAYALAHGKYKYDVDDVDPTFIQEGVGFLLGMLSPLEIGLFTAAGPVGGKIAGKVGTTLGYKATMGKGLHTLHKANIGKGAIGPMTKAHHIAQDKIINKYMLKEGITHKALNLATYSASATAITNSGQQRLQIAAGTRDKFSMGELFTESAKSFGIGTILGGTAGWITTPMARKFAIASQEAEKKGLNYLKGYSHNYAAKLRNSPASQVFLESQAFTTGQIAEEHLGAWWNNEKAPEINLRNWLQKTFNNSIIIGGLKAGHKIANRALRLEQQNDVTRYFSTREAILRETFGTRQTFDKKSTDPMLDKEKEAIENIIDDYAKEGYESPTEVYEKYVDVETARHLNKVEQGTAEAKMKRLAKLDEKVYTEDGALDLYKLGAAERAEWVELNIETNIYRLGLYTKLLKNPKHAEKVHEDAIGKAPSEMIQELVNKVLEKKIAEGQKLSNLLNDGVKLSLDSPILNQIKAGNTKFSTKIEKQTDGKYKVSLLNDAGEVIESTVAKNRKFANTIVELWTSDIANVLKGAPKPTTKPKPTKPVIPTYEVDKLNNPMLLSAIDSNQKNIIKYKGTPDEAKFKGLLKEAEAELDLRISQKKLLLKDLGPYPEIQKATAKRLKTKPTEKVVKADKSGTPEQQVEFWKQEVESWRNSVESIKRDLKAATSGGEKQNLQSQLRGASMQLWAAKEKVKQAQKLTKEIVDEKKTRTVQVKVDKKLNKEEQKADIQLALEDKPKGDEWVYYQSGVVPRYYKAELFFGRVKKYKGIWAQVEKKVEAKVAEKETQEESLQRINKDAAELAKSTEFNIDELDKFKGKSLITPENPDAYDIPGMDKYFNKRRKELLGFETLDTPDQTIKKHKGQPQIEDKAIEIANKLDSEKIKFKYDDTSKLNESYYDIHEIALNHFPTRKAGRGPRAKTGALVETSTDLRYIEIYNEFAKVLSKKNKSLRDASWQDILDFVTNSPASKDALAILYRRLNNKHLIKSSEVKGNIDEISKIIGKIPEKPEKGLRTEDIDLENSRIKYIQSKTYGEKGVPISEKLKNLLESILPEKGKRNTLFKDIDGNSLIKRPVENLIKKYFGGKKTLKDFRSALSQYVATKYGTNSNEWAVVEAVGLAHTQAKGTKEQRAYVKGIRLDEKFTELRNEFVKLIEGTGKLPDNLKGKYLEGGLTVEELRIGLSKALKDKGNVKLGHTTIDPTTKEAILRFMIETSPRPQDVIPPTKADIKYVKPTRIKQIEAEKEEINYQNAKKLLKGEEGWDPELGMNIFTPQNVKILNAMKVVGARHIKRGVKNLQQFSKSMIKDFGNKIRPFLSKLYKEVKAYLREPKIGLGIEDVSKKTKPSKKAKPSKWAPKVEKETIPTEYDAKLAETIAGNIEKEMKTLFVVLGVKGPGKGIEKDVIVESISKLAEITDAEGEPITYKFKDINPADIKDPIQHWHNLKLIESRLKKMTVPGVKRATDVSKWYRIYSDVEKMRLGEKSITEANQKLLLTELGVKDGDVWKTNLKQLRDYRDVIHKARVFEKTGVDWIDRKMILQAEKDPRLSAPGGMAKLEARMLAFPIERVARIYGYRSIEKRLKAHVAIEQGHIGALDVFVNDVIKGFTTDGIYTKGLGERRWRKTKNDLWSVDYRGERIIENMKILKENPEGLSSADKKQIKSAEKFFRKAIQPEFFLDKEGKETAELTPKNLKKYVNMETPEGRLVARHVKFMKYFEDMITKILKIRLNPAEYEKFMIEGNIDFIKDGIYLTRPLTKEFLEMVDMGDPAITNIVDKRILTLAKKDAIKKYGENPTVKQINEFRNEKTEQQAYEDLYDSGQFNFEKIASKALIKRVPKWPEFIKDNKGNLVRTYETQWDMTGGSYSIGMAKFLATLELFPEFVNIKGFKPSGTESAKALIKKIELGKGVKTKALSNYVKESFNMRLGIGQFNPFKTLTGRAQEMTNVLAKVGLSGPKSGGKNIVAGTAGSFYAYDTIFMMRAFADVIRGEGRELIGTGKDSVGLSYFNEGKTTEILDITAFRAGLIKPTEKFNRSLATLASKYDQRHIFKQIKFGEKGEKVYDYAYDRATKFYELTPEQVKLVLKYGFNSEHVNRADFKTTRDFVTEQRNHENAIQLMNTMAHIKTQGAAIELFMPKLAHEGWIRPLTMYKRMAYASSFNTLDNVNHARKGGVRDWSKIMMGTLAHYYGGKALIGLVSLSLGQVMPKENSPEWRNILTSLFKGEFLGLGSELLSPWEDRGIQNMFMPSIIMTTGLLLKQLFETFDIKKSVDHMFRGEFKKAILTRDSKHIFGKKQAVDTILRRTVAIYNDYYKYLERKQNPLNRDRIRTKDMYSHFLEVRGGGKGGGPQDFSPSSVQPYTTNLRIAFFQGNDEDFWRAYETLKAVLTMNNWNVGYAELPDGIRDVGSKLEAEHFAIAQMKTLVTNLNPNPAGVRIGDTDKTRRRKKKYRNWVLGITVDKPEGDVSKKFQSFVPFKKMTGQQILDRQAELGDEFYAKLKHLREVYPYYNRKFTKSKEIQRIIKSLEIEDLK